MPAVWSRLTPPETMPSLVTDKFVGDVLLDGCVTLVKGEWSIAVAT